MIRKVFLVVFTVLVASLVLTGCPNIEQGETPATGAAKTPAAAAKGGTELARVGDDVITLEEFQSRLDKIPPFYKKRVATKEGKMEFLDRMVMDELYYQEAIRKGLDGDPEYLEQIEAMKKNLLSGRVRKEALEQDVSPTDDQVAEYYENHPDEFKIPEKVTVKHILVKVSRKATEDEKAKARQKIDEAHKKLLGKTAFEDVAKEYSEDRHSAKKGGEIPPVRKGVKSKEFDEAAFGLGKPGEISGVFEDRRGFNIVQFVSKEEAKIKEFEKVERQIKRKLENENRKAMLEQFTENLKAKANIVIHEDLLESEESEPTVDKTAIPAPKEVEEEKAEKK